MKKYYLPLVLVFQMILLFTEVPSWVIGTCFVFLVISVVPGVKSLPQLKVVTGLISVIVVIVVVRNFNFILSNELIASLLIILTSIRLIEHRYKYISDTEKPPYFLFLLGLFLAVVKFVFQIDFIFGLYAFLATAFYLYQFLPEDFKKNHRKESFRIIRSIIGYSVPITAILFLVFPQFKMSGNRQRNYGLFSTIGASGFSAELRPGSISELVNNENIAFRAEFENFTPAKDKLYWRGQVLDRSLGLVWRRTNPGNRSVKEAEAEAGVNLPNYKIVLEPHLKEQLFTLNDTVFLKTSENMLRSEKNNTFSLPTVLLDRLVYFGYLQTGRPHNLIGDQADYLHLHRRVATVEELSKSLINGQVLSAEQKVKSIAKYFADNQFEYRLSDPNLAVNSIEDFLFKTKVGFCEHYASVTALLLRYMNVPSRVVVGYQGGEFNNVGKFWTIKQLDAHAWVEYLNENNQWVLFDPINAIPPDRVIGRSGLLSSTSNSFFKNLTKNSQTLDQISNYFEIFNYRWTLFFVEYSSANLRRALAEFYQKSQTAQLVTGLAAVFAGLYLSFYYFRKYIFKKYSLSDQYHRKLHQFFNDKLPQNDNESFSDWKSRLKQKYPDRAEQIESLFEIYLRNRYGTEPSKDEFKQFIALLSNKDFQS